MHDLDSVISFVSAGCWSSLPGFSVATIVMVYFLRLCLILGGFGAVCFVSSVFGVWLSLGFVVVSLHFEAGLGWTLDRTLDCSLVSLDIKKSGAK